MSWLLMRCAFLQNLQNDLYKEAASFGDLESMSKDNAPLMYSMIHEVLRLHPAVNALPLMTRKKCSFGDNLILEEGWTVVINVQQIGLNNRHFNEPLKFNNQRFIDNEGNFRTDDGFVAFNVGPRACLGKQVALQEISIAVAKILLTSNTPEEKK